MQADTVRSLPMVGMPMVRQNLNWGVGVLHIDRLTKKLDWPKGTVSFEKEKQLGTH